MALFANYLLEKKIIAAEDLVNAILEQILQSPHPAQLALENKLLSPEEIIGIFSLQSENNWDFLTALRAIHHGNDSQLKKIEELVAKKQKSLITVLMEKNLLSKKDVVKALDDYIAQTPSPAASGTSSSVGTAPAQVAPKKTVSSSSSIAAAPTPSVSGSTVASSASSTSSAPSSAPASLESTTSAPKGTEKSKGDFNFVAIQPSVGNELQGILSLKAVSELKNVLDLAKQNISNQGLVDEFLQDVARTLTTIKGIAQKGPAPVIESTCELMEKAIQTKVKESPRNEKQLEDDFLPGLAMGFIFCMQAKDCILTSATEENFWNEQKNTLTTIRTKLSA